MTARGLSRTCSCSQPSPASTLSRNPDSRDGPLAPSPLFFELPPPSRASLPQAPAQPAARPGLPASGPRSRREPAHEDRGPSPACTCPCGARGAHTHTGTCSYMGSQPFTPTHRGSHTCTLAPGRPCLVSAPSWSWLQVSKEGLVRMGSLGRGGGGDREQQTTQPTPRPGLSAELPLSRPRSHG